MGDKNPQNLISFRGSTRRKLRHVDTTLQNGSAKNGKTASRSERIDRSEERNREDINDIRYEAGMCYLRGLCYAKQNAFDKAKECYKDAVCIDVQCFEAFDQLMKNCLMSPEEEWKFLESLDFDIITSDDGTSTSQEAAEFTKMLYTTRLSKYEHPEQFTAATEALCTHYNLSSNSDILLSKADMLFTQCRFKEALKLTSWTLEQDRYNFAALPVHLACLHELNEKNALFLLAHDLADHHPDEPTAWLAVGVYYLTIGRVAEARRFFSKASMMDPHFGPAWIGFAHTFAAEGEHDQAISAYSTAARLFQGTHLPPLFLGMQNLQLNNMPLAREYLEAAHGFCRSDPLLLNELGVVAYHDERLVDAIRLFRHALALAESIGADPRAWLPTRANLGHACRRASMYADALAAFDDVLRAGGRNAAIFAAKGLTLLETGDAWAAVLAFHEALSVSPQDPIATELLGKALEASDDGTFLNGPGTGGTAAGTAAGSFGGADGTDEDALLDARLQEAAREASKRLRYRRTARRRMMPAGNYDDKAGSGSGSGTGVGARAGTGTAGLGSGNSNSNSNGIDMDVTSANSEAPSHDIFTTNANTNTTTTTARSMPAPATPIRGATVTVPAAATAAAAASTTANPNSQMATNEDHDGDLMIDDV